MILVLVISVNCPFHILFFTSSLAWTRKEIYNTIDLIHLFATDSGLPSPVLRLRICSLFLLSLSFSLMLVLCSSSWAVPTLATFPCDHPWGKAKWLQYYIYESGSYCWERKKISNGIYKVWQMAPQSWKGGTVDFRLCSCHLQPPTTILQISFHFDFHWGTVGFRFGDMGAALLVKRFESTSVKLAILKIKMLHRCKIFPAGVKNSNDTS